jgi:hypothetical protein
VHRCSTDRHNALVGVALRRRSRGFRLGQYADAKSPEVGATLSES